MSILIKPRLNLSYNPFNIIFLRTSRHQKEHNFSYNNLFLYMLIFFTSTNHSKILSRFSLLTSNLPVNTSTFFLNKPAFTYVLSYKE